MMKRVLVTTEKDDVKRILDQIPYTGSYFTNSLSAGTYTTHYAARGIELARVTEKAGPDGKRRYTVRILAD